MSKEDKKVIHIETLRVNYARKKICECEIPLLELDYRNRLVYCRRCQAIIEPFDALYKLATHAQQFNDDVDRAAKFKKELDNYKPYLREARRYEQMMRQKEMLPICPKCSQLFNWNELVSMGNKKFYKEEKQK